MRIEDIATMEAEVYEAKAPHNILNEYGIIPARGYDRFE
jgi:hypothetical protein